MEEELKKQVEDLLARVAKLEEQRAAQEARERSFDVELRSAFLQMVAFIERKHNLTRQRQVQDA